ncbi:MAG TPA: hypothetical protein VHG32_05190 [Thermoanaerobaculia bacterium]|nr:hypothetical protein [Thermoanaerobaculia bacterium]
MSVLRLLLPEIETVLAKGGTALPNFTLHDEDHSFRVAERMVDVLPKSVLPALSVPELALLLVSAYLHDIGMTPQRGKVSAHYEWLTISAGDLSEQEKEEFERWLAEQNRPLTPPLFHGAPTVDQLSLAEEMVAYYCRHKHNEWGKYWIEKNLAVDALSGYPSWREDVIDLCQSHHWNYELLLDESLDPKSLHSGEVIHLRYLACVLRVADILENDPERTPPVIFRHRSIAPKSRIYWWKDQALVLKIRSDNRRISIRARPHTAVVHRAILDTATSIEHELRLCRRLDADKPFRFFPDDQDLPHAWDLGDSVFLDVHAHKNYYTFIEGSFRPNTEKLLELLAGTAIYQNPMAAARELLQNAFDAVREHVAYQRLHLPDSERPADPAWEEKLGQAHLVRLSLEKDSETRWWLVCTDDGAGMTREIVENNLLVSGTVARSDLIDLEHRCARKGFSVGRTAQFGIGVLSYFMIADRIEIYTQRSTVLSAGEAWTFTTEGVGTFGELRRSQARGRGTTVRLRLNENLLRLKYWYHSLRNYILDQVLWIPCRLSLFGFLGPSDSDDPGPGSSSLDDLVLDPGWRWSVGAQKQRFLSLVRWPDDRIKEELLDRIAWHVTEGRIGEGLARYRLILPFFKLPLGRSAIYMRLKEIVGAADCAEIQPIQAGYFFTFNAHLLVSFKGMKTDTAGQISNKLGHLEVDWLSNRAGMLSVARTHLEVNAPAIQLLNSTISELVSEAIRGVYPLLLLVNSRVVRLQLTCGSGLPWMVDDSEQEDGRRYLRQVRFPAIVFDRFLMSRGRRLIDLNIAAAFEMADELDVFEWRVAQGTFERLGTKLEIVHGLIQRYAVADDPSASMLLNRDIEFDYRRFPPDTVLYYGSAQIFSVIPLWTTCPKHDQEPQTYAFAEFPPSWCELLAVEWNDLWLLNGAHPLVHGESAYNVNRALGAPMLPSSERLSFVASLLTTNPWFDETNTRAMLEGLHISRILIWHEKDDLDERRLDVSDGSKTQKIRRREEIEAYLPPPAESWQVIYKPPTIDVTAHQHP